MDLIIRGGTVVTADSQQMWDVGVHDGKVAAVGTPGSLPDAASVIEADGLLVLPGLVDPHVHFGHRVRIDGEWVIAADTFLDATASAAVGGTTMVIDFAVQRENLAGEALADRLSSVDGNAVVDYGFHVVLTANNQETVQALPGLIAAGAPSWKMYMTYRKQGRMAEDGLLLAVFEEAARLNAMVGVHAENSSVSEFRTDRLAEQGKTEPVHFAEAKPDFVESEAIHRALFFAELTGVALYIFHVSTRAGLALIRDARNRGVKVYAETCPHYLLLSASQYAGADGHLYICSPPLRSSDDAEALWRGIDEGLISIVSSDHCGFGTDTKDRGRHNFLAAPNGLPGAELRLPLLFTDGVKGGLITIQQLVSVLSTNSARTFGLYPKKGALMPGSDADIALVDPNKARTVHAADLQSVVDWSPYEGRRLFGWPVLTLLRGEVIARDRQAAMTSPRGAYVARSGANA